MFYHYGQACSKKKMEFKAYFYFLRDKGFRQGYEEVEWERYRQNIFLPNWEKRMRQDNVHPYDGPHPEAIQPLMGTFWKRDEEADSN
jgi:hypothetical protein